jgi:hypothetical protein
LLALADGPAFLARRLPYFSSCRCFRVIESDKVGVDIAVLVSRGDEVAFEMVMYRPERVVIVEARMQFSGLAKVQSQRRVIGMNTLQCTQ